MKCALTSLFQQEGRQDLLEAALSVAAIVTAWETFLAWSDELKR